LSKSAIFVPFLYKLKPSKFAEVFAHDKATFPMVVFGAISIEKAKKNLGYNPKYSIEQGIKEAVSWYFHNLK
jgi:nucleoside-diphosphate-sugar epimerase